MAEERRGAVYLGRSSFSMHPARIPTAAPAKIEKSETDKLIAEADRKTPPPPGSKVSDAVPATMVAAAPGVTPGEMKAAPFATPSPVVLSSAPAIEKRTSAPFSKIDKKPPLPAFVTEKKTPVSDVRRSRLPTPAMGGAMNGQSIPGAIPGAKRTSSASRAMPSPLQRSVQLERALTISRSAFAGFGLITFACGILTAMAIDRLRSPGSTSAAMTAAVEQRMQSAGAGATEHGDQRAEGVGAGATAAGAAASAASAEKVPSPTTAASPAATATTTAPAAAVTPPGTQPATEEEHTKAVALPQKPAEEAKAAAHSEPGTAAATKTEATDDVKQEPPKTEAAREASAPEGAAKKDATPKQTAKETAKETAKKEKPAVAAKASADAPASKGGTKAAAKAAKEGRARSVAVAPEKGAGKVAHAAASAEKGKGKGVGADPKQPPATDAAEKKSDVGAKKKWVDPFDESAAP